MSDNLVNSNLIVGAGNIALEYAKVLLAMKSSFEVFGRGKKSAQTFFNKTGIEPHLGDLNIYLKKHGNRYSCAIVAVDINHLTSVVTSLIKGGVKRILVEKPLSYEEKEIVNLIKLQDKHNARVYVAYNRRFYSSVLECKKRIQKENGVTSYNFEFTEWIHKLSRLNITAKDKKNWLFANSTHIIDLALFLGGEPKEISAYAKRIGSWPSNTCFSGSGKTRTGALFSYSANWTSPGRWSLEIMTNKHRYIFRPIEELRIQKIGSTEIELVEIDNKLDLEFKPGFYRQVDAFLNKKDSQNLLTLEEHLGRYSIYKRIANGK